MLAAIAVIMLWWPIKLLLSHFLYKRRVTKITQNMPALSDYPILGCALRFLGKNNEGLFLLANQMLFDFNRVFSNSRNFLDYNRV